MRDVLNNDRAGPCAWVPPCVFVPPVACSCRLDVALTSRCVLVATHAPSEILVVPSSEGT